MSQKNILYRAYDAVIECTNSTPCYYGYASLKPSVVTAEILTYSGSLYTVSLTSHLNCWNAIFTRYDDGIFCEKLILDSVCNGDEKKYLAQINAHFYSLLNRE